MAEIATIARKVWRAIKRTLTWLGYSVLWVLCGLSLLGSFQCLVNPPISEEEARSFAIEVLYRNHYQFGLCPFDLQGPVLAGVYNFGYFFTWSYRREGHTLSAHLLVHKWGRAESSGSLDLDWCEDTPMPTPASEP
jgi:hypothetical protein